MDYISRLVNSLTPSATLAMSQKSSELRASGADVINLSVGEPDFETPRHIKDAAIRAIEENYSFYTPVAGYMSLREAVADTVKREDGVDCTPDRIVVGNGAKQALCNVILSTVNPGDEVIIPVPAWVSYAEMVKLAGGRAVEVETTYDNSFKLTPEQLEGAINGKTKMIILCSPSNPTGAVYSPEELRGLADVLKSHPGVIVLADEIYRHIDYTGRFRSMATFPEIADRTVVVNGVSKAYAMTGWRIGYLNAPAAIAKACTKLQSQTTSNPCSIAQKAAEAALRGPQDCVREMRDVFRRRRDLIMELAAGIPGWKLKEPQGAFYIFPGVEAYIGLSDGRRTISSSADLVMYLLEEAWVATVDGGAFGMPGYIRLSYATSDDNIRKAMDRISKALSRLRTGGSAEKPDPTQLPK